MKKILLFLLFSPLLMFSQSYLHQILILNEGYFDYSINQIIVPPTIGSYDPVTEIYTTVATISGARFASDIIIAGDFFYVAADNMLYKYDKNDYSVLCTQQIDGIRNIAVWNDKIIATRGDYDNFTFMPVFFDSYVQLFNTSDLSFYSELDTISGPKWSTQNMIINNDNLYVAINNAYEWGNEKGLIGVVDMTSFSYINEIDLGPDGKNPDNMLFDGSYIYTVNNKDWTGASISKIDLFNSIGTTINMSQISTGCGTSCLRNGKINYQISGDVDLYEWDTQNTPASGSALGFSQNFYTLSFDDLHNNLYASSTDHTSYGMIHIFDLNNNETSSFNCGVSPGKIVFDFRNPLFINSPQVSDLNSNIYDSFGRKIENDFSKLSQGFYIINQKKIFKSE